MEELETSGLLKEEEAQAEQPLSHPADAAPALQAGAQAATAPASMDQQAAAPPLEDGPQQSDVSQQPNNLDGSSKAGEEASGSGQAEQRILGSLVGCPGWHEVMDMGSGKVYFWNEETNEVAWDSPVGAIPRSRQHNEELFAACQGTQQLQQQEGAMDQEQQEGLADVSLGGGAEGKRGEQPAVAQLEEADGSRNPAAGRKAGELGCTSAEAQPGSGSEKEEGQLDQTTDVMPEMPLEEVGSCGEALLKKAWEASERLCGPAPLLVRLAVEVEVRLRDWNALSKRQRQAAASKRLDMSLSWAGYQQIVQASLRSLEAAFPLAVEEAQRASAAAAAAVTDVKAVAAAAAAMPAELDQEEGEVPDQETTPPLPAEPGSPQHADMDIDMDIDAEPMQCQTSEQKAKIAESSVAASTAQAPAAAEAQALTASTAPSVQNSAIINSLASHSAAMPAQPAMMVPVPAAAPQWPGYYHQYAAYPYPFLVPMHHGHMPYHPYAHPAAAVSAAAPVSPAAAETQPPLPADSAPAAAAASGAASSHMHVETQPPLPSDSAGAPAAAVKQDVGGAEVRPLPASTSPGQVSPEPAEGNAPAPALGPVIAEEDRKRKREKPWDKPVKKRKPLKVGKATSSLIDKWAAVRKDLVSPPRTP